MLKKKAKAPLRNPKELAKAIAKMITLGQKPPRKSGGKKR